MAVIDLSSKFNSTEYFQKKLIQSEEDDASIEQKKFLQVYLDKLKKEQELKEQKINLVFTSVLYYHSSYDDQI